MPDFIIIDKHDGHWSGQEQWFIIGYAETFPTLSAALKAADAIKAREGGIIANISGKPRRSENPNV